MGIKLGITRIYIHSENWRWTWKVWNSDGSIVPNCLIVRLKKSSIVYYIYIYINLTFKDIIVKF